MSDREKAEQLLDAVPDYKVGYVIAYLQGVTVGEEEPNEETLQAFAEIDKMKQTGEAQHFDGSTKDFLNMLLED